MDKFAQRRGFFNKLREKANLPKKYLEGFFRPEFERIMEALSKLDDSIRANLAGEKIEEATPEDKISAKDLVKQARRNFNRNEFIAGITDLGRFHQKMEDVSTAIEKFEKIDVDSIHAKFLFQDLPKDKKENYEDRFQALRERMEKRQQDKKQAAYTQQELIKEAGIADFLHNTFTNRGRSLSAWTKKYPKATKNLKDGGTQLVESAQALLDHTMAALKEMATARATRTPDAYIESAKTIISQTAKFDKAYSTYYTTAVVPFIKIKDAMEAEAKRKEEAEVAKEKQEQLSEPVSPSASVSTPNVPNVVVAPPAVPSGPPAGVGISSPPFATPPEKSWPFDNDKDRPPVPQSKPLQENIDKETGEIIRAHQNFYTSLETLSQEDPRILAGYIAKYAQSIQASDLETSIKLLGIVKSIRG